MLAGRVVKGVTIVFAPLGANSGPAIVEDSFALIGNMRIATTAWTGPGDGNDADDLQQAYLLDTALVTGCNGERHTPCRCRDYWV